VSTPVQVPEERSRDLKAAYHALDRMLKDEYGQLPLMEIVDTWGRYADGVTGADIEAIRRIEARP
jgi:hypothetical protein